MRVISLILSFIWSKHSEVVLGDASARVTFRARGDQAWCFDTWAGDGDVGVHTCSSMGSTGACLEFWNFAYYGLLSTGDAIGTVYVDSCRLFQSAQVRGYVQMYHPLAASPCLPAGQALSAGKHSPNSECVGCSPACRSDASLMKLS